MNIREAVARRISNSGDDIKTAVIEELASQVIDQASFASGTSIRGTRQGGKGTTEVKS